MTAKIFVTTRFRAFHLWADAPDTAAFLRFLHRHEFHVRVEFSVKHDDRDLEFFLLQGLVDKIVRNRLLEYLKASEFRLSCEQMARLLVEELQAIQYPVTRCEVSEDGENGAIIEV